MSNLASLFDRYKALVIFDTETSGLNPGDDQIIELAALRVERTQAGALRIAGKMDTFIRLPEGERLPENIVTLTGITDRLLETEGVQSGTAVSRFLKLVKPGPVLMVAHNAQFDACFLRELLRGFKPGHLDWLDGADRVMPRSAGLQRPARLPSQARQRDHRLRPHRQGAEQPSRHRRRAGPVRGAEGHGRGTGRPRQLCQPVRL